MKPESHSAPPELAVLNDQQAKLAAKCDGSNQFENFDKLFRAVIAVPKAAIDKEEAKYKRARAKKKRAKKPS